MQEINKPRQAEMIPLIMLLPEIPAMIVSPKTQTRKYSAVPMFAATFATWGARNKRVSAEKIPPKVDA